MQDLKLKNVKIIKLMEKRSRTMSDFNLSIDMQVYWAASRWHCYALF